MVSQPPGLGGTPSVGQRRSGLDEGLLDHLLGEVEVAEPPGQRGDDLAELGAEDVLDRAVGHVGHSPWKGRTSTGPRQAFEPRAAMARAASRSGASMIQNPPICSLASM